MTRAIVFDVDGVLVHSYHSRPHLQTTWDEKLLIKLGIEPARFRDEFIFDIFIKKVVIGQMPLVEALDRRLPSLGYKGSSMAFAQIWMGHHSEVDHALFDLVKRLQALPDIRLFIATNQDHMRAQWLWQTIGLGALFEDMFYSARVGVMKPHRAFFDFAETRMGPLSEPPLFFDDTPKVVDGARLHGWDAVLFRTVDDVLTHPWIAARLDAEKSAAPAPALT